MHLFRKFLYLDIWNNDSYCCFFFFLLHDFAVFWYIFDAAVKPGAIQSVMICMMTVMKVMNSFASTQLRPFPHIHPIFFSLDNFFGLVHNPPPPSKSQTSLPPPPWTPTPSFLRKKKIRLWYKCWKQMRLHRDCLHPSICPDSACAHSWRSC